MQTAISPLVARMQTALLLLLGKRSLLAGFLLLLPRCAATAFEPLVAAARDNRCDASGWKRLGKTALDAGETAEAYRLFRQGAKYCPDSLELVHHSRVYDLFHGDEPNEIPQQQTARRGDFVAFEIPADAAPAALAAAEGLDLVFASSFPLLSREECDRLVAAAERVGSRRGWTTDRHADAPTCDLPVYELRREVAQWVAQMTRERLFPAVSELFPHTVPDSSTLRCQDCFVVRYDGNEAAGPGFRALRAHQDESLISLTVALNDRDCYQDGGLWIASTGDVLNGDAGTALCFAGEVTHGGFPVARGTRWILTMFLHVDANASGREPGYMLSEVVGPDVL